MRSKLFLVLALGMTMMFNEGCSIQQLLAGMQQPGGPLGQQQIPGIGVQQGPLDGSFAGGLAPFSPDTTSNTPGAIAGLNPQAPTNVPTAPGTTPIDPNAALTPPAPIDPNATTPPAIAGTPLATPVGGGPIDPATMPMLPAAGVNVNPLAALSPTLPQPAGL